MIKSKKILTEEEIEALEEAEDIKVIEERKNEKAVPFERLFRYKK